MKIKKAIAKAVKNQCDVRKPLKFKGRSCTVYLREISTDITSRDAEDAIVNFGEEIHHLFNGISPDFTITRTEKGMKFSSDDDVDDGISLRLEMTLRGTFKKPRIIIEWLVIESFSGSYDDE